MGGVPAEQFLLHWLAYHMRTDLCVTLVCPMVFRSSTKQGLLCETVFRTWDALAVHLCERHHLQVEDDIYTKYRWIGHPFKRKERPRTPDTTHELVRFAMFRDPYCSAALPFTGMLFRYAQLLGFESCNSRVGILSRLDAQLFFQSVWLEDGYKGPPGKESRSETLKQVRKKLLHGQKGHLAYYFCYGEEKPEPEVPDWALDRQPPPKGWVPPGYEPCYNWDRFKWK